MALILRSIFFLMSLNLISTNEAFSKQSHIMLPSSLEYQRTEKVTNLHFYYHDIKNKNNPTIVQIVNTPKNVPNEFGSTYVMDDEITEGPEMNSKNIGRAQGLFGQASLHGIGMFMLTNFVFTNGTYAGSTLSMLGMNPVSEQNRELPIVGGTGMFRFARGYAIANSLYSISSPDNFVMEYNITVYHL
ncbi:dirigent protein 21-like [Trifolium pratense]|uniref:dirigent protein 21-like n=1 Tax=Trifolium pratense TaxID=57577 RepID=UPI001E6958F2|nr:dirigent protein 21-like [Trifolium pratense]